MEEAGAVFFAALDIGHYSVELNAGDLRPLGDVCFEGPADLGRFFGVFGEGLDEVVVDALFDVDPTCAGTDLALVVHDPNVGPFDGLVDVGVCEDDARAFASAFERDVLQVSRRGFHDGAAGGSAAGECNLVYASM